MKLLSLSALLLVAGPLLAQATSSTIPAGFDNKGGGQPFFHWASTAGRTMQVIDQSNNRPRAIRTLAFRRLAGRTSSAATGTLDIEIVMAECPWGLVDTHFDSNQQIGRSVVLKGKVNLPDWRTATTSPKFDMIFTFTKPFVYTRRAALLWTIRYSNSTSGTRVMDRAFGAIQTRATGATLGAGCTGTADTMRLDNSGNYAAGVGMHFLVGATGAPANAPAWLLVDGKASNINVPGLCTRLRALPTLLVPIGKANARGILTKKYLNIPYIAGLQGATLVTQVMFFDPSQRGLPFRLTGGRTANMPSSGNVNGTASAYAWASGATATQAIGDWFFYTGAPVAEGK